MMKKISIFLLAMVMVLSLTVGAMAENTGNSTTSAAPTLATSNDIGVAGTWTAKDTVIPQARNINIVKEIKSFNATSASVHAPEYTYIYTVKPATVSSLTVTDETTDHASSTSVVAPVRAGITTGLVVKTGSTTGEAGNASQAVGTLVFMNSSTFDTSAEGTTNSYNINLDFANVAFSKPGVYRYEITESLADSKTYAGIDVKPGNGAETKVRYLDVYVDGKDSDNDGKLDIYGYVCLNANASVANDTTKTNGFVNDTYTGHDNYYTYDLTLSKDVVNDSYAEGAVAFPFTVIFNNTESFTTNYTITETAASGSTGISPTAAHAPTWSGVARVKDGANITYTGIPAGVDVDVYETNIVDGVTYTVVTTVNGTDGTPDNNVNWTATIPSEAAAQANPKTNTYESTKATVNTVKYTTSAAGTTAAQTLKITNTLLQISPTGVVLRIAPYALILAAGIALLLISRRRKAAHEEE